MNDYFKKLFLLKARLSNSMLAKPMTDLASTFSRAKNQPNKQKTKNHKQATTKEEERLSKKYTPVIIIENNKGGKSIQKVSL